MEHFKKLPLVFFLLTGMAAVAQQSNTKMIKQIKKDVNFLASDALEGRRTGTYGEMKAAKYIAAKFKQAGLSSIDSFTNYLQTFTVKEKKQISPASFITTNGKTYKGEELKLMPYSGPAERSKNGGAQTAIISIPAIKNLNASNPHYDLAAAVYDSAKRIADANTASLIIFAGGDAAALDYSGTGALPVPVVQIPNYNSNTAGINTFDITIEQPVSMGHNVIGYINNQKPFTIVLGAHYDHLGYGQDHNSLYTGAAAIHNGADDNASGTAALIQLANILKRQNNAAYNYLFLAFSGEELGLYGSKFFVEHSPVPFNTINYMINMDMVGRLNTETRGLSIGGFGTSPAWANIIKEDDPYFKIKRDSSGSGPSDHTSFYRKDIPVLFFFTGTHTDYHKPTDDADKLNYAGEAEVINYIKKLINYTNSQPRISFLKTREMQMGKASFKVSLGIMPDYTFEGTGVKVDGVSAGKLAEKLGIKAGDIILQLGNYAFTDVMSYMNTLSKFNKGDASTLVLLRDGKEIKLNLVF